VRKIQAPYDWRTFAGDVSGGLVAALIALPYGLAMASLMGLPPVSGLVTSVVTAPVITLLGRNPLLIGGTASATVPFIAQSVREHGTAGAAKVCLAASIFLLIFCFLRLGRFIRKVPYSVITGFSCGIGAMMILSQLSDVLGVHAAVDRGSNNLLYQNWQVLTHFREGQLSTVVVSLAVIVTAAACARFFPKAPAPLVGVAFAALICEMFAIHLPEIGNLQLSLPHLVAFSWRGSDLATVLTPALGLAFVSAVNLLVTSRVIENFHGRHKQLKSSDADNELGAYGLANILACVFAAPMSVGIPARSLASIRSGATTRMSNLLHAIFLLAFVLFGRSYIVHMPIPALAGVTVYIGLSLLEWGTWRRLFKMNRVDALAFLATSVATLVVNAASAVAIGCAFHVGRFAYRKFVRSPNHTFDTRKWLWRFDSDSSL
jgi:sulfate permease, SulP family